MKWLLPSVLLLSVAGCAPKSTLDDVQFAKSTYMALADGTPTVESAIDFNSLKMMGIDVGPMYSKMPTEEAKKAFRTAFLTSYSKSYKSTGATANSMTNWRLHSSKPPRSVVATDGKGGTLYVTIEQKDGTQKLVSLGTSP